MKTYREQLAFIIDDLYQNTDFEKIEDNNGPETIAQGHLLGKSSGLLQALSLYDETHQDAKLVPLEPIEDLSAQMLSQARAALERSRHEAYPGTEDEIRGYARGLQKAGDDLQALLAKLQGVTSE